MGSKDFIFCGDGYDIVFYNSRDGDVVSDDCEEKHDYTPPNPPAQPPSPPARPPGANEDCDRSGMPGCPN
jgi:hypothetical protein